MLFDVEFDGEYLSGKKILSKQYIVRYLKNSAFLHNLNVCQIPNRFCKANFFAQKLAFLHGSD